MYLDLGVVGNPMGPAAKQTIARNSAAGGREVEPETRASGWPRI